MDNKADAKTIERAYTLDVAEFMGQKILSADSPQLAQQVVTALYNHSRRTKKSQSISIDYAIAFHWPKLVYLDNKQFAQEINQILSGIRLTPAQAKQRRVRLNLSSRCPPGRRASNDII
jgi:hypothetical protein